MFRAPALHSCALLVVCAIGSLTDVHPQSGGVAALCCKAFQEKGAGMVGWIYPVGWDLSPHPSMGTRGGAFACCGSSLMCTEVMSSSLAHDGSIGQLLVQGSGEKPGLCVSCTQSVALLLSL